ncbi:MAG: PhoH family protein [Yaniella sp.]|uniref:PhoH family protein n=2 Tax=Yaniella sp. TaxID=2773929 RepID=UPI002648AE56|nr:PhoH family protein [Yaniella sp.]MDN5814674.1 PhoH family protein [Yaniella sp.]MDN5837243.1 PhoH family protein [Yaniella sp.]MDN6350425.1 PhoH family protein [Yaniella sp.]MDN6357129.1 PhoH family protein [Yaniella sp.]
MSRQTITFSSQSDMVQTFGPSDMLLRVVEGVYPGLKLLVRDQQLDLEGHTDDVSAAVEIVNDLQAVARAGTTVGPEVIEASIAGVRTFQDTNSISGPAELIVASQGKKIRPKTENQKVYVNAINNNTVVFGVGPAGTGKTYLAMAKAIQALQAREVNRIILTRPAVEAGESLGYLPGSLSEKIDPYLRPLYDALHEMIEPETIPHLIEVGTIEVAPLAYMRGRTLNDAFIILDEAQNTSAEQMKMFLTRLGFNSHMVITGDSSQVDLPRGTDSGLVQAIDYLEGIDDIAIVKLKSSDVVRHNLVSRIVDAYDRHQPEPTRPQRAGRNRNR